MRKRFNIFYTFNRQRSGKYMYFLNFTNFYYGFSFQPNHLSTEIQQKFSPKQGFLILI